MQKGLKFISLQGIYWKNEWLDGNIIISYFGGSTNIFAVCNPDPLGKIILVRLIRNPGIKGAYWISSNSSFIQYCDSNIGFFSIAPPLVIALPTLR